MGYSIFFHFVKDGEIDPNEAFVQNIRNFQSDLSRGVIKRYIERDQDERDELLTVLFKEIESLIVSEEYHFDILQNNSLSEEHIKTHKDFLKNEEMIENAEENIKVLKMVQQEGLQVQDYIKNDKLLENFKEKYQEKYELKFVHAILIL